MTGINSLRIVLASLLMLFSGSVNAEEAIGNTLDGTDNTVVAGKILLTVGEVYSKRNASKVTLKRRSKVLEQDEIHVGSGARAQIRMVDSALISLQENSVLKIKKYRYQKDNQENSALLELLSGGLRTITGKIGKSNKKAYELRTPLATIGIRGTDYEVKVVGDGLYVGVWEGGIDLNSITSENNHIILGNDHQFSFAYMSPQGEIKGLDTAPAVFSNEPAKPIKSIKPTKQNDSTSSASSTKALPDPEVLSEELLASLPDKTPNLKAIALNQTNPSGVIHANATGVNAAEPILEVDGVVIKLNSDATNVEQSIGGYNVNWGHWAGFTSTTNEGSTQSDNDLLWTTYEPSSAESVSARTGSVRYDNVMDSRVSGSQGDVTHLNVNMDVNFDSGAVSNGMVSANTHSDTWIGIFDGQVNNGDLDLQMNDASVISSDPLAATVQVRDASGSINGDFIGEQAQGVVGAFELSEDNTTHHIGGVFVVEPK